MNALTLSSLIVVGTLLPNLPLRGLAQDRTQTGDLGLNYEWVRTNTPPGKCGCFGLNGGDVSASLLLSHRLSAAAQLSAGYQGHGPDMEGSLTLVSLLAGPRLSLGTMKNGEYRRFEPFAQVLVGGAHAGGGLAGAGDGSYAFAGRAGGGVDVKLTHSVAWQIFQVDYYLTTFANNVNAHQNNLLLGSGFVYRWRK